MLRATNGPCGVAKATVDDKHFFDSLAVKDWETYLVRSRQLHVRPREAQACDTLYCGVYEVTGNVTEQVETQNRKRPTRGFSKQ